ncbi:MAG: hypothetical protein ACI4RR_08860 [Eubacterium sp.]
MKKIILFAFTLVFLLFGSIICAQGAQITQSYTDENQTVHITVAPGGEDDTAVLRKIMTDNASSALSLVFSAGEYNISATLPIYDNTSIFAQNAVINQTTDGKGILINANCLNGVGTPSKAYGSLKNVEIDGGLWCTTARADKSKTLKDNGYYVGYSTFLFMHAQNITVKNCSFKNNYNGHFVEFAGVKNGKIINCDMALKDSTYVGEMSNEAIQLDNTYQQSNSPVGFPWDDTACKNILVKNCKIKYARGIGTNRIGNKFFESIVIEGCKITALNEGINIYDTLGVTVKNSTVTSLGKKDDYTSSGVYIGLDSKVKSKKKCNVTIQGNKITGYHAGLKICVPKNNTKFNTVTVKGNRLYSKKNKSKAFVVSYNGKQINKLIFDKNTVKKK